jgi:hypothetical protein
MEAVSAIAVHKKTWTRISMACMETDHKLLPVTTGVMSCINLQDGVYSTPV